MGSQGDIYDAVQKAQPTTIKVFDFDSEQNLLRLHNAAPGAQLIYRKYVDGDYKSLSADAFVVMLQPFLGKLASVGLTQAVVFEGLNEPIISNADEANALNAWYLRFAQLMHSDGLKVAAFSFSTGNPDFKLVPLLAGAAQASDFIALHEYHNPTYGDGDIGRCAGFHAWLPANARKPILITETGSDDGRNGGWMSYYKPDAYLNILNGIDNTYAAIPAVVGANIYQFGAGGDWKTFDVGPITVQLTSTILNYHPTPTAPTINAPAAPAPTPAPVTPPAPTQGGNTMDDGWYPNAVKRPLANHNYWDGHQPRKAVVLHIAEGPLSAIYPTFNDPNTQASTHFAIGKDGTVEQYVSINDSAWGNGDINNPSWSGLTGDNPNLYTISIEHEGDYHDNWTTAMLNSQVALLQWIAQKLTTANGPFIYVPHQTLIGHYEIDSVNRINCPGPNVNYTLLANLANTNLPPAVQITVTLTTSGYNVRWDADHIQAIYFDGGGTVGHGLTTLTAAPGQHNIVVHYRDGSVQSFSVGWSEKQGGS